MNCINCEIARAKFKVPVLLALGWSLDRIAKHLSDCYGEQYTVDANVGNGAILRASKLAPYTSYLIYES